MNFLLYFASYLLGAVPFGFLIARSRGIDIQAVGSGNTGATNVWRTLGPGAGLTTLILDIAKGLAPALAGFLLLGDREQALLCGGLALLGHTFSPFLRFKGGKGVATGLGALLGATPMAAGIGLAVFIVFMAITRFVSLSSLVATLAIAVSGIFLYPSPFVKSALVVLMLYIAVRHRENVSRLIKGTEPKFSIRAPKPANPEEPEGSP